MTVRKFSSILALVLYLYISLLQAQSLSQWQLLYDQGAYCDLLIQLDGNNSRTDQVNENKLSLQLLRAKTLLELEQWDELDQYLTDFSVFDWNKESKELEIEYQLFLSRHAKKELWELADSLFIWLVYKTDLYGYLRSEVYAEYGLYLTHRQDHVKAEKFLLMADSMTQSNSIIRAKVKDALAFLYLMQSKINRSKKYFTEAENIWESTQWKASPYYSHFLNDFALYFYVQGDLLSADSLLSLSEQLNETACTTPSLKGYQASARAQILFGLGDYEKAIEKYQVALGFFRQAENHADAVIALSNLGEANFFLGQIDTAQKHYTDALKLADAFYPHMSNPQRAQILLGLAGIEEYNFNDPAADSLYLFALEIMEKAASENSATYGTTLSNYARFKEGSEDLTTAIKLYKKTEILDSLLLGANHPDYKTTLYNLARSYSKIDSVNQALAYYQKANNLQLKLLNNYFGSFDVETRLSYRLEAMGNFDVFFSYACMTKNEEFSTEIEDINLATKNLVLDYARGLQSKLNLDQSAEEEAIYHEWLQSRKLLAELYFASNAEREDRNLAIDSMEERVNSLEKLLARQTSAPINHELINTSRVIAKLSEHEAAIDFFNYHVTDEYGRLPDSILYYASIMTATQESPELVYLCSQRVLDDILMASSHYTYNVDVNHLLYKTIWAPIEEFLNDVQRIHLSPEGLLHQISFAALLPDPSLSETLIDRFDFSYYSNLRDFVVPGKTHKNISSIYLMGSPDFGKAANESTASLPGYFSDLPETGQEISNITSLLKNTNISIKVELGINAKEPALYEYLGTFDPSIVHLATHGFFYPRDTSITEPRNLGERIRSSPIPLLRSGFALSGANSSWSVDTPLPPSSDGIVTAQEVANLNMQNTELIVLSACETGRGGIADGEGVFGLHRAFKMAGVSQLLISLWDVPDAVTTTLMTSFYRLLLTGLTPHDALLHAQRALKEQYPSPYDWAAFVLFQ